MKSLCLGIFGLLGATTAVTAFADPPVGKVLLPVLSYTVIQSGPSTGTHPKRSDLVTVNYDVKRLDGTVIDSSFKRGKPNEFSLDKLIPAWQILIQQMRPGDDWTFYVPPEYAYGDRVDEELPANSFLIFHVKLLSARAGEAAKGDR